jgi:hypothetical protein
MIDSQIDSQQSQLSPCNKQNGHNFTNCSVEPLYNFRGMSQKSLNQNHYNLPDQNGRHGKSLRPNQNKNDESGLNYFDFNDDSIVSENDNKARYSYSNLMKLYFETGGMEYSRCYEETAKYAYDDLELEMRVFTPKERNNPNRLESNISRRHTTFLPLPQQTGHIRNVQNSQSAISQPLAVKNPKYKLRNISSLDCICIQKALNIHRKFRFN